MLRNYKVGHPDVVYSVADEDQVKGKLFARFKGLFFSNRGFNDKRVWYLWVETKHLGILRGRGLKDIRVDAFLLQKAVVAFLVPDNANYPFECITKTTAKGSAFIGRKAYVLFGANGKPEFCQPKCFEHIDQTNRN